MWRSLALLSRNRLINRKEFLLNLSLFFIRRFSYCIHFCINILQRSTIDVPAGVWRNHVFTNVSKKVKHSPSNTFLLQLKHLKHSDKIKNYDKKAQPQENVHFVSAGFCHGSGFCQYGRIMFSIMLFYFRYFFLSGNHFFHFWEHTWAY